MDLTLSDEQRLLSESARHFAEQVCPTTVVREVAASIGSAWAASVTIPVANAGDSMLSGVF